MSQHGFLEFLAAVLLAALLAYFGWRRRSIRSWSDFAAGIVAALLLFFLIYSQGMLGTGSQSFEVPNPSSAEDDSPPNEVALIFSEKLEPAFSSVVVRDAIGNRVDQGQTYVDKAGGVMRDSLEPLRPGIYIVEWRAVATGTHRTEGAFIFRVGE